MLNQKQTTRPKTAATLTKKEQAFTDTVWSFYDEYGREYLPWRKQITPYRVLVSELMLQQTQVPRVIPKFKAFIEKWPTSKELAKASLGEVLTSWQGLGYNRRAKYLQLTAKEIEDNRHGVFPTNYEELLELPGVGPYTAGAITAFAFNKPVTLVETNIRQVYLQYFFKDAEAVSDQQIKKLLQRTLPLTNTRAWYSALMDYGTHLKRIHGNRTQASASYKKQSPFKGSNREIRGRILQLLSRQPLSAVVIEEQTNFDMVRLDHQLRSLVDEGLVKKSGKLYRLPN